MYLKTIQITSTKIVFICIITKFDTRFDKINI